MLLKELAALCPSRKVSIMKTMLSITPMTNRSNVTMCSLSLIFTKEQKVAFTDQFVGTVYPHSLKDTISRFTFFMIMFSIPRTKVCKRLDPYLSKTLNPKNLPKTQCEMEVLN